MKIYPSNIKRLLAPLSSKPEAPSIESVYMPYDDTAMERLGCVMYALQLRALPVEAFALGRRAFVSIQAEEIARAERTLPDMVALTDLGGEHPRVMGIPCLLDPFADDDSVRALTTFRGFSETQQVREEARRLARQSKCP